MRYRIEYLTETTEEDSVCHVNLTYAVDLQTALAQAWVNARGVRASSARMGFKYATCKMAEKLSS